MALANFVYGKHVEVSVSNTNTREQFYNFSWKSGARVATTADGNFSTAYAEDQVVDGVTLILGDRILIKDQTDNRTNGIYTVNATGAPTRAFDFDGTSDISSGANIPVTNGTINQDKSFVLTSDSPEIDTSPLVFVEITSSSDPLKANIASPTFTGTVGGINKTMVGLGSADNTADTAKPVSTSQLTALNLKADTTALNLKADRASPTFTGTVSGVSKAHVGLSNVDNTADTAKPVSTAQQTAVNLKANLTGATFTGQVDATTFGGTKNILAHVIHDPTSKLQLGLSTSYAIVGGGNLKTTFTPPTGITDVIVETQCYILTTTNFRHIYLGLSGHSGSTTYSEFLGAYSISGGRTTEAFVGYSDYKYRNSVTHKWHLVGLTPGTSYHINLGAKGSGTFCYLGMGGDVGKGDLAVYYYDSTHGFAGEGTGGY